mmetsp:Transcript_288/g.580  ORF Transcript_288/g.580 Transcript_288/m.580 type:complete len:116 (-) Transcript_288:114-461(-)
MVDVAVVTGRSLKFCVHDHADVLAAAAVIATADHLTTDASIAARPRLSTCVGELVARAGVLLTRARILFACATVSSVEIIFDKPLMLAGLFESRARDRLRQESVEAVYTAVGLLL